MPKATVIPVASGKGGVGKTFLTANLAMALARKGARVLAVDLDLGGSNLHSFLGIANRHPGVGDFLKARVSELSGLIVPTGIRDLGLLTGEGRTPFMANLPFAQKQRLLRAVHALPADYILLDLGAGTAYDTLDFFRASPRGLLVTTPEYPAIMGVLGFIKHCCLRTVTRSVSKRPPVREHIQGLFKRPMVEGRLTMQRILDETRRLDPEAAGLIERALEGFRPRLVFNLGTHPDELKVTPKIDRSLREMLSVDVDHFGFVFDDPAVRASVREGVPFLTRHEDRPAGKALIQLAERVDRFWNQAIPESARRIHARAVELDKEREAHPPPSP